MRNVEMFDKVAKAIEDSPERYDQNDYAVEKSCGTAYCIAGWTAYLDGWQFDIGDDGWFSDWVHKTGTDIREEKLIDVVAEELLGVSNAESDVLFASNWIPPKGMSVPDALRGIGRGTVDIELPDYDE